MGHAAGEETFDALAKAELERSEAWNSLSIANMKLANAEARVQQLEKELNNSRESCRTQQEQQRKHKEKHHGTNSRRSNT